MRQVLAEQREKLFKIVPPAIFDVFALRLPLNASHAQRMAEVQRKIGR
jgi:hypothetical protein